MPRGAVRGRWRTRKGLARSAAVGVCRSHTPSYRRSLFSRSPRFVCDLHRCRPRKARRDGMGRGARGRASDDTRRGRRVRAGDEGTVPTSRVPSATGRHAIHHSHAPRAGGSDPARPRSTRPRRSQRTLDLRAHRHNPRRQDPAQAEFSIPIPGSGLGGGATAASAGPGVGPPTSERLWRKFFRIQAKNT